jgi:hypothetical protein
MSLQKLRTWYARKSPVELWLDLLRTAEAFEDWEEAALHLDNLLGLDLWQVCLQNAMSTWMRYANTVTGGTIQLLNITTGDSLQNV